MTIPRLPPAAKSYTVSVTVNAKLLPYFQMWYQRKKLAEETSEDFVIRMLKAGALNDYLADVGQVEMNTIEQSRTDAMAALSADVKVLDGEL